MTRDILMDLREQYATLDRMDRDAYSRWEQNVGFWLLRLKHEEDYQRWVICLAMQMQRVRGGLPIECCVRSVEEAVAAAILIREGGSDPCAKT